MSERDPVAREDPTGFPCPHERVREYGGKVDRDVKPARYVERGVCYVCGYGVHREKRAAHVGALAGHDPRNPFTPWSVFPGSTRDPLVVRRPAKR